MNADVVGVWKQKKPLLVAAHPYLRNKVIPKRGDWKALKSGEGLQYCSSGKWEKHVCNRTAGVTLREQLRLVLVQIIASVLYGCDFSFSSSEAMLKKCLQLRSAPRGLPEGHEVHPSLQIVWIISQHQGKPSKLNGWTLLFWSPSSSCFCCILVSGPGFLREPNDRQA